MWAMHQRITNWSQPHPILRSKLLMSTLLHQKTLCRLIWCQSYPRPVATIIYEKFNQDAKTYVKVIFDIMIKHAYLPTTLISDKGSTIVSHVITEVAGVHGVNLKYATTKHAQTIGLLEWSHASIKETLEIETGERRSLWHKYVSIVVLHYLTSYHTSLDCEQGRVFYGRIAYNIWELKSGIRQQQALIPTSQIAEDVPDQRQMIYQDVRRNSMQAYIQNKAYYDKKSNPSKVKEAEYVYILHPETDHQGSKIPFMKYRWIGPYIIGKMLPNKNYLVRKIGTNGTQVLHRMRMRQFTPQKPLPDIRRGRRETWSGSKPQSCWWWFVCQSLGVWIRKANFRRQKR